VSFHSKYQSLFFILENYSRKCKAENKICLTVKSYAAQCLSFWLNPETRILQNFKNAGVIFFVFFLTPQMLYLSQERGACRIL
jgi:hypothetical protein